jgi:peptidoglycan/LPS O-acetylase OafA/YrhL
MKNQFVELYRFILILWIVAFHYTTRYAQLYPNTVKYPYEFNNGGYVGVFLFFVISGYFFAYSLNKVKLNGLITTFKFSVNKYWRLFPSYIISIIIIFIIVSMLGLKGRESNIIDLFGNFLIWHPYCKYIDSAHWFIASLVVIQTFMAFTYFICKSELKTATFLSLFVLTIIYILRIYMDISFIEKLTCILDIRDMLIFIIGMLIWIVDNKKVSIYASFAVLFMIIFFVYHENNIYIIFYLLLFIVILNKRISKINISPIVLYLGKISFSWYLIHQNIGFIIIRELNVMGYTSEFFLCIPILITLCLAFAVDYVADKFPKIIVK